MLSSRLLPSTCLNPHNPHSPGVYLMHRKSPELARPAGWVSRAVAAWAMPHSGRRNASPFPSPLSLRGAIDRGWELGGPGMPPSMAQVCLLGPWDPWLLLQRQGTRQDLTHSNRLALPPHTSPLVQSEAVMGEKGTCLPPSQMTSCLWAYSLTVRRGSMGGACMGSGDKMPGPHLSFDAF